MLEQEIEVSGRLRLVLEKCGNYRASKWTASEGFIGCQPDELIPFVCVDSVMPIDESWLPPSLR
jgi:hypothetical protein